MNHIIKYRTELMGVSILWIMFFHSSIHIPEILLPLKFIKAIGYIGVDVFFLLSGIGLTFSISKNKSLKSFYLRRIIRVIPTFWVCLLIIGFKDFTLDAFRTSDFLLSLLGLDFLILGKLKTWFIPSIILCYIIFPLYYMLSINHGYAKVLFSFCTIIIVACLYIINSPIQYILIFTVRIPIFFFGVYIGLLLVDGKHLKINDNFLSQWILNNTILVFSVATLLILIIKTDDAFRWRTGLWWYPTIIMAFPFSMLVAYLFYRIQHILPSVLNFFRLFGALSLELYLVHPVVFDLANYFLLNQYDVNFYRIPEYTIYVFMSLIFSILLNRCLSNIDWLYNHNRVRAV